MSGADAGARGSVLVVLGLGTSGPAPGTQVPQHVVDAVGDLVRHARAAQVPVVWVRDVDGPSGTGDPAGPAFAGGLGPVGEEFTVDKHRLSAFHATELDIVLRAHRADRVVLAGAWTDVDVLYTAADAHQGDYHVHVVTDAVAGTSAQAHRDALEAIRYLQRDAVLGAAEATGRWAASTAGAVR